MQQQQQQQRQGSQQRPRFQPPPPQTNVLNLTNVGGPGVPSGPLSPGGSAYPSQRFGGPVQGAMKPSQPASYPSPPTQNTSQNRPPFNPHYSIYSEYGAMESQADSSELASNANRDSRDLKDEARRMAEELFASTSFGTSAPGIDTGYQRGPTGQEGWLQPNSQLAQNQELKYIDETQAQAPVKFGVGMGHIAAPTTFYTETLSPDFGQLEEDDDEPQGYAAPPQQQQQQHKQPQGYGNYQQQPSQQVMGGPQGYAGQPSGYGGPHNTRQPVQQQQQHPGMRNAGPVDNSTMEDDDRWKGYPPPGQLIPENEREARSADNAGIRSNPRQKSIDRSVSPTANYPPPSAADDLMAVIFSGHLFKQNRRGTFQKRLFRFDGLLLICLSPKRHRLPEHINLLTFDPARHTRTDVSKEFISALGRFYPTNPPMPALTNPLIASYQGEGKEGSNPDIYTKYYHMPKWIIPTAAMQSVQSVVPHPARDPESKAARTFVIHTQNRDYILRASTAAEYRRWTFLLSRMSAAGGDSASLIPSNRELTAMVRDNDEVEDEDDDDDNDQDASEPHPLPPQQPRQVVMDPTHPSLARMGAWQRSVADLIVRDQAAGTSVMSVSNSDGTTTMERGLTNRRSRLTNSSGSEGYRYPPLTAGAPPVPAIPQTFPQNLKPTRGDSLNGRPNNGTPPRPNYPMPVPLRPEQLQPPDGRVMKGPTIFGAAIAAGVHPTTPIIGPGGGGSRDGPSPASDVGDTPSPPLKKGASIRQMQRATDHRMSVISSDGFAIPTAYLNKPTHSPSPLNPVPRFQKIDDEDPIALDPQSLTDLQNATTSLLRILRRLQGDDSDESSPIPSTRRNPITSPLPATRVYPTKEFVMSFVTVSVPFFVERVGGVLKKGGRRTLGARVEGCVGEWEEVVRLVKNAGNGGEVKRVVDERREIVGRFVEVIEEVRRKVAL